MRKHYYPRAISRRDFLKVAAAGLGSLASLSLSPWTRLFSLEDFPQAERLGRVCVGMAELKMRPDYASETIRSVYEDTVFPWIKEVVGPRPWENNQRWVETPEGYLWCREIQPVKNQPQTPLNKLSQVGDDPGMWVEVSVPYVDAVLDNPSVYSAWWRYRESNGQPFRFYYSQILWIDQVKTESDGSIWYRVNERYGNPGDIFWCPAEAFREITPEEVAPIRPDVADKRIVVDVNEKTQILSCFEGNTEVYFCRVSSGIEGNDHGTPLAPYPSPGFEVWRKLFSLHMGGNTAGGAWDVPAVGWTTLFEQNGVAIHSTYWHNNYGNQMSHGCVNVSPEDAKWIFRWVNPIVPFNTGDNNVTITGDDSTRVIVNHW